MTRETSNDDARTQLAEALGEEWGDALRRSVRTHRVTELSGDARRRVLRAATTGAAITGVDAERGREALHDSWLPFSTIATGGTRRFAVAAAGACLLLIATVAAWWLTPPAGEFPSIERAHDIAHEPKTRMPDDTIADHRAVAGIPSFAAPTKSRVAAQLTAATVGPPPHHATLSLLRSGVRRNGESDAAQSVEIADDESATIDSQASPSVSPAKKGRRGFVGTSFRGRRSNRSQGSETNATNTIEQ